MRRGLVVKRLAPAMAAKKTQDVCQSVLASPEPKQRNTTTFDVVKPCLERQLSLLTPTETATALVVDS
jgi:hypothetical protein